MTLKLLSLNNNIKLSEQSTLDKILYICEISGIKPKLGGTDHEVEFHEIEIQLFQEVKLSIMRSKFDFFMGSNLFNNI